MQSVYVKPPVQAATPPAQRAQDDVFDRSRFLLRQKHFSLSEKYFVWDEGGHKLLLVERPRHHLRSILALVGAVATLIVVGFMVAAVAAALPESIQAVFVVFGILFGGLGTAIGMGVAISAKRHVYFYRDETKRELVLKVEQDRKFQFLSATYTVKDRAGAVLALLSKKYLYNMFRKRWYCNAPNGELVCVIKEDSILRSIARRLFGPLLGLLRTNFVFLCGDQEIGRFDRQFTLLDRYVLDVTTDVTGVLDRRVALAIGVMLDTGEKR